MNKGTPAKRPMVRGGWPEVFRLLPSQAELIAIATVKTPLYDQVSIVVTRFTMPRPFRQCRGEPANGIFPYPSNFGCHSGRAGGSLN